MHIRQATADDVPALFAVRTSVRDNHMDMAELAELGITPTSLPEMLIGNGCGWVAEVGSEIVAFAMADTEDGCVFALFVRPEHEGNGFGKALLGEAEAWLFARNLQEIWLLTDARREVRANGFYRHLGWHDAGVQADGQTRFVKRPD